MVLSEKISRRDTVSALGEVFVHMDLEVVFYDIDGTILNTTPEFLSRYRDYSKFIAGRADRNVDPDRIYDLLLAYDNDMRMIENNVRPHTFIVPATTLAKMYGVEDNEELSGALDQLLQAYRSLPPEFDGVNEQVELVKEGGLRSYTLTHAEARWTEMKLRSLAWGSVFDGTYNVAIDGPKDAEAWLRGMDRFGAEPSRAIIVGDSLTSDVLPAIEIGAGLVVWVAGESKEETPEGVVKIEYIRELVGALLELDF